MKPSCRLRSVALLALALAFVACTKQQIGLPRVALATPSPDGRAIAFVKNHLSLDPPSQSIWLTCEGHDSVRVERLAENSAWCSTICWSADSTRVGFLIAETRLKVVDIISGATVFNAWIVEDTGTFPSTFVARDLRMSEDGESATFRPCRRHGECAATVTLGFLR